MKKSVSILSALFFVFLCSVCFATPLTVSMSGSVNPNRFEMIMKKPEYLKHNLSLSSSENNGVLELVIDNCIQAPDLDDDKDGHCVKYELNIVYKVPLEGATFYSIYYLRTKQRGGEWGEWEKTFTGVTRYWSQEDAENNYIEFSHLLTVEGDGDIPPSIAQFKVELYTDSNVLEDVFETASNKRKYWFPALIETDNHDKEDSQ